MCCTCASAHVKPPPLPGLLLRPRNSPQANPRTLLPFQAPHHSRSVTVCCAASTSTQACGSGSKGSHSGHMAAAKPPQPPQPCHHSREKGRVRAACSQGTSETEGAAVAWPLAGMAPPALPAYLQAAHHQHTCSAGRKMSAEQEHTQPVGTNTCLLVGGAKLEGRVAGRDVAVQCVALELGQHIAAGGEQGGMQRLRVGMSVHVTGRHVAGYRAWHWLGMGWVAQLSARPCVSGMLPQLLCKPAAQQDEAQVLDQHTWRHATPHTQLNACPASHHAATA